MPDKRTDAEYLEVISDLAEAIEMKLDPIPVLLKHKTVIDDAYAYVINTKVR